EERRAPPVAGLGVDQDGVDREGVDLPLPPVAALPARPVGRREALQHEALDAALAGALAEARELVPRARDRLRDLEVAARDGLEAPAAARERLLAAVLALGLEEVVRHEGDGRGVEDRPGELLAADPGLEDPEGERPAVREGEHLAVEDGPVRQRARAR